MGKTPNRSLTEMPISYIATDVNWVIPRNAGSFLLNVPIQNMRDDLSFEIEDADVTIVDIAVNGYVLEVTIPVGTALGDLSLSVITPGNFTNAQLQFSLANNQQTRISVIDGVPADFEVIGEDTIDIYTTMASNDAQIAANTANISTNAGDISTNATNISTNETAINNNVSNIATNTINVGNNATNIANNTGQIATNTANIATNTTEILNNDTNINNNTTNIGTNTTNITANATAITALQAQAYPEVADEIDRDTTYPSPVNDFEVYNRRIESLERYDGTAGLWLSSEKFLAVTSDLTLVSKRIVRVDSAFDDGDGEKADVQYPTNPNNNEQVIGVVIETGNNIGSPVTHKYVSVATRGQYYVNNAEPLLAGEPVSARVSGPASDVGEASNDSGSTGVMGFCLQNSGSNVDYPNSVLINISLTAEFF
jgi:hypothetical protein